MPSYYNPKLDDYYNAVVERVARRRRCGDPYVTIPRDPEIITRPPIWRYLWAAITWAITWPFKAVIWGLLMVLVEWDATLTDIVRKGKKAKRRLEPWEAGNFAFAWTIVLGGLVLVLPIWGH